MKNYELISKLEKLPAGAEVSFDCICEPKEVSVENDSDNEEYYVVSKKICSVDFDNERIMLS